MTKPGDRVRIIEDYREGHSATGEYGVYEGDSAIQGFPSFNPRIRLDDGNIIWGYQCWWGDAGA